MDHALWALWVVPDPVNQYSVENLPLVLLNCLENVFPQSHIYVVIGIP